MKNQADKTGQTVLAQSARTGCHFEKPSLQINDLNTEVRHVGLDKTPAEMQEMTLDELAGQIRAATTAIAAASRTIALAIYAARQIHFPDRPADWLAWAARECGIRRSHCFCMLLVGRMLSTLPPEMYEQNKFTDIVKLEIIAGAPETYWIGILSDDQAMALDRDGLRAHVASLTGGMVGDGGKDTEKKAKAISRLASYQWAEGELMKTLDGLTVGQCSQVGQFGLAVLEAQVVTGRIGELPAAERQELAAEMIRLANEINKG